MTATRTWVIGAGGLIGSAIVRTGDVETFPAAGIPWGRPAAADVLRAELDRFVAWAGSEPWGIVWAAGAGIMNTGQAALDDELAVFGAFCRRAAEVLAAGRGGFYLVSSAGGVYAGSVSPPFDADTVPRPLNAYGRAKLAQEEIAVDLLAPVVPVTIGRLANVYGPGQNLTKQQGLVTQLALCSVLNRPATIFAPLSTLRDYVYVDDAARVVTADVTRMAVGAVPGVERRVVCSGRSTSIAELMSLVRDATGLGLPMIHRLAPGPHILDLRLTPSAVPHTGGPPTSLESGVVLVHRDLLRQLGAGHLALV